MVSEFSVHDLAGGEAEHHGRKCVVKEYAQLMVARK
jgi:hypothetical protein